MSKRLKNYPDPVEVVNKYGADALRLVGAKSELNTVGAVILLRYTR